MNCFKGLTGALMIGVVGMMTQMSSAATYYVKTNGNDSADGTSWEAAKQTIQAGVNAAGSNGTVLVTNGEYVLSGQIVVSNGIAIRSVNGPTETIVNGNGQVTYSRCFYLSANAILDGLTITNGLALSADGGGVYATSSGAVMTNCVLKGNIADNNGGGAYGSTLNNCTLAGNTAYQGGGAYGSILNKCTLVMNTSSWTGGGICSSTLNNSTVATNSSGWSGGGVSRSTLNNCVLTGNSGNEGGGGFDSTLNNCILTGNEASDCGGGSFAGTLNNCMLVGNTAYQGGWAYYSTLNNCTVMGNVGGGVGCSLYNSIVYYNGGQNAGGNSPVRFTCAPDAPAGFGNTTNEPMFVNTNSGNYRLSAGSPCIDTGYNMYAPTNTTPVDLDGNLRIWNGTVDMGAYEYGSVPPAPTGVWASDGVYTDKIYVTWISTYASTGFEVWVSTANNAASAVKLFDTTATSCDHTAAVVGTVYWYWVKTKSATSTSDFSFSDSGYLASLPVILSQPQSKTNYIGDFITFSLTATGTVPLYYQWQKNMTNISEATNTSFTINPVAKSDEGGYRCIVSNMDGCVTSAVAILTVLKLSQTITFNNPGPQIATNIVGLVMSSDSGLMVTGSVIAGSAYASIANGTNLTFTGYGEVTIRASQTGDVNYIAATPVDQTFTVTRAAAMIALNNLSQTYNGTARIVTATTVPPGLAVFITYDGSTAVPVDVGSYAVIATIMDGNFHGVASGTLVVARASQTITFPTIPDQIVTNQIILAATASSGLPVAFSVGSGPAVILEGNSLRFTNMGLVVIVASQIGNINWNAATPVVNIFNVQPAHSLAQGILDADFDGDRKADPSVYDEFAGTWTVKMSGSSYATITLAALLGGLGYTDATADYDADRLVDPAVYQETTGNWIILQSSSGYARLERNALLGGPGWSAASADYDSDRIADCAVYQETTGNWKIKLSASVYSEMDLMGGFLGSPGYSAVSADYDGDGLADPAVYNRIDGTWKILLSGTWYMPLVLPHFLGGTDWNAVPGDYDGDGLADPAVRKFDGTEWRILLSASGYILISIPMGL